MQFTNPSFLFALFALAIPVIIHLFNFRKHKTVYFSNIGFLKEVKNEQKSVSQLRNILILLARLLTFLFLILAFAQPFLPFEGKENGGTAFTTIYIDNSQSMEALSYSSSLLTEAKGKAKEIVRSTSESMPIQIISNDLSRQNQFLLDREEALLAIEAIELSSKVSPVSDIVGSFLEVQARERLGAATMFLLSDLQKITFDAENLKDTLNTYIILPSESSTVNNVGIDSAWFEAPTVVLNQVNQLIVKSTNYGNKPAENLQLTIKEADKVRPAGTITIAANTTRYDTIPFTMMKSGYQEAVVRITDYPVTFDDNYYISFPVKDRVNIIALGDQESNRYLNSAFSNNEYVSLHYISIQNINYNDLKLQDLIILDDLSTLNSGLISVLKEFVNAGGNLLVFPGIPKNGKTLTEFTQAFAITPFSNYNTMENKVTLINDREFVFSNVYKKISSDIQLPSVQAYYPISINRNISAEKIMEFRNGEPYLIKYQAGLGNIYTCAASLNIDYNNLATSGEVFIPMLFKIALSGNTSQKLAYSLGGAETIKIPLNSESITAPREETYRMDGTESFIPQQQMRNNTLIITPGSQVVTDGIYNLTSKSGDIITKVAYNYDRQESDLSIYSVDDLRTLLNSNYQILPQDIQNTLEAYVKNFESGKQLWKWCLILALLFIFAEVLLIRTRRS